MDKTMAVIEDASIHRIYDLFRRKPSGLKFNDTDALVVTAREDDGGIVSRTFYFCLKPDGTFSREPLNGAGTMGRRRRLAAFLKYYGLAEDVSRYNLREGVGNWKGRTVEVVKLKRSSVIYIP